MDTDFSLSRDYKEQLNVEESEGSYASECVSGDWSAKVHQQNLAATKPEPDDVCCVVCVTISLLLLLHFYRIRLPWRRSAIAKVGTLT